LINATTTITNMPPKRPPPTTTAASATTYTDPAGTRANKRSRVSKPVPSIFQKLAPPEPLVARNVSNGGPGATVASEADGEVKDEDVQFDHSRPEEKSGIVDRRYYPPEMSNERCARYNENEIPRPVEVLAATLSDAASTRAAIRDAGTGDAVVHWFKRDLRVRDNTGLSAASALAKKMGKGVIGIWILSPQDWEAHLVSAAKCDFELRSVEALRGELEEMGIPLVIEVVEKRREVPARLVEMVTQWGAKNVFCNIEYEPDELRREEKLVKLMLEAGVNFDPQHDDCVVPPGTLKTGGGKQYAVYSPWYRNWVGYLHAHAHVLDERPMPTPNSPEFREKYKHLFNARVPEAPASKQLTDEDKERLHRLYPAGEAAALERLERFLKEKIGKYKDTRNFPSLNSTARLSVHHAAGTLAARTSVRLARDINTTRKLDGGIQGIQSWISEVAWRDFYRHVLCHWPYVWLVPPPSPSFSR
jgi:deoxyribodipyrimidine photo-lyase